MRNISGAVLAGLCVLFLLPATLPALDFVQAKTDKPKSQGAGKGGQQGQQSQGQGEFRLDFMVDFSVKDARRCAADNNLVGQKPLPPGVRKNLARGKPLPPGIAKRNLPTSFVKQLPGHQGYEWRMAGTDLVLISTADNVVREIAEDVFE